MAAARGWTVLTTGAALVLLLLRWLEHTRVVPEPAHCPHAVSTAAAAGDWLESPPTLLAGWATQESHLANAHERLLGSQEFQALSAECQAWLINYPQLDTFTSQLGQDWFLYVNFFRGKRGGTFLEIGANHPKEWSNSYFFENCLGWRGVCVDANPKFAEEFAASHERTCAFENVCISNTSEPLRFKPDGWTGKVVEFSAAGVVTVPCMTLDSLLKKHDITHVDVMFIDIEGAEQSALTPFPSRATIDVVVMETFWSTSSLHWLMTDHGYWRMADVGMVDDVYVRSGRPAVFPSMQQSQRQGHYKMLKEVQQRTHTCVNGP